MADAFATLPIPTRLLNALLLVLALLIAPHATNLNPLVLTFFYLASAWRLFAIRRPRMMPGRLILGLLLLAAVALVLFTTGLGDGRLTGTALLVVMLGLKLLELRTRRDMHVTLYLGYFVVFTLFLYGQSLWLAVYAFGGVFVLAMIQVGLNRVRVDLRQQVLRAGSMLAGALPLAIVMFLLFPRLDSPLWAISTSGATTGMSGEMSIGDIGSLSQSRETAFRVRFAGEVPPASQRYWRGPVLWETDGRNWTAGSRALRRDDSDMPYRAAPLHYEVTIEPTGEYWLFGLDLVTDPPVGAFINRNDALISEQRIDERITYLAGSDPQRRPNTLSPYEQRFGLQLPARVSARTRALAEQWRARANGQALQIADLALNHFRAQPFVYTLEPGRLGKDPIDEFLFETQRGFCEHYASSFVTLMRVAGVPSRIVLGYQGGEFNPRGGHWTVRQSDAHAWAEIWVPRLGWQRIDPTAAVAPERIEHAIDTGLSRSAERVVFADRGDGLLSGIWRNAAWIVDAVDIGWHRWVTGFSAQRQDNLLQKLGLHDLHGFSLSITLIGACALAVALVYIVAKLPRPSRRDPLPALWQRFIGKLRRAGIDTAPWQGPDTLCRHAMARYPEAVDELTAINRLYVQLRYGRRRHTQQVHALRNRIRDLRLTS